MPQQTAQLSPARPRHLTPGPKNPCVSVSLTAVARHWCIDPETARRVLKAHGAKDQRSHATPRYLWRDIHAIERDGTLAQAAWPDTRDPLLTANAIAVAMALDASSARRYAARGRLIATRLGPRLLRFHPACLPSSPLDEVVS